MDLLLAIRENSGSAIEFSEYKLVDTEVFQEVLSKYRGRVVPSVGSGAWRLSNDIRDVSGALLEKHREPICIWTAIKHVLNEPDYMMEAYKFVYKTPDLAQYPISAPFPDREVLLDSMISVSYAELTDSFPILLVNVKTGTSFYRIDSPNDFVRVGGSSIGASTIHALGKSLTFCSPSTESLLKLGLSVEGPSKSDLLVEDIYGGDCSSIGLPGSIIASCFGKTDIHTNMSDLAKSAIDLMCINTAQLTNLHAQLNGCRSAVIVGAIGNVEHELEITECIQRVLNILSGSSSTPLGAIFFNQAKYLGCLGALLRRESLIDSLSVPVDSATMVDGVDEETYTKLRVLTPPRNK